jgi:hypothetical protein
MNSHSSLSRLRTALRTSAATLRRVARTEHEIGEQYPEHRDSAYQGEFNATAAADRIEEHLDTLRKSETRQL